VKRNTVAQSKSLVTEMETSANRRLSNGTLIGSSGMEKMTQTTKMTARTMRQTLIMTELQKSIQPQQAGVICLL